MSELRRWALTTLFVLGAIATLWFALIVEWRLGTPGLLPLRGDHFVHAVSFAALTLLGHLLWAPLPVLSGVMVAAGGLLELVQGPVGRQTDVTDWIAGSAGVLLGTIAFVVIASVLALRTAAQTPEKGRP